jgi:hypothetical protein
VADMLQTRTGLPVTVTIVNSWRAPGRSGRTATQKTGGPGMGSPDVKEGITG